MKVILVSDIEGLGSKGKILEVKDGFARNYLLPQGKAFEATESNIRILRTREDKDNKLKEKDRKLAQGLAEKLSKLSLTLACQAKNNEELFGSVNAGMIASGLKEEGFDIDKEKIELPEPIKNLGIYNVKVRLQADVEAEVKIWVVKK
ncbi:MAG: 50S ribosomal protein L9 [Candidatus Omnitrophica bacterium]|nr:50S ribosomal protein L9 [Candidatus Omnitrophota bacterium]